MMKMINNDIKKLYMIFELMITRDKSNHATYIAKQTRLYIPRNFAPIDQLLHPIDLILVNIHIAINVSHYQEMNFPIIVYNGKRQLELKYLLKKHNQHLLPEEANCI